MARPTVTAAALRKARELAAHSETGRPVVAVSWEPPAHDKKRGAGGETVWIHSKGTWSVFVGDMHFAQDAEVETTKIGGLEFFFCLPDPAPSLDDITIDYAEGEFIVR